MTDVQTHMRVQDAIETAILDRGVEPPADLADIVFAAAQAALESAPSSLREELAEARAEIARLTEEKDQWYDSARRTEAKLTGALQVSAVMLDALGGTFTFTDAALREVDGTMYRYEQPDRLGWTVSRDPELQSPPVVLPVAVERGQG